MAHLEFRNLAPQREDWVRHHGHATFRRRIAADAGENLLAIPRKQRAEVRKGIDRGLTAGAAADAGRWWDLYATSVHRHGTPVYARRYFDDLKQAFGDDCEFFFAHRDGRPVASLLNFYFRDEVLPYYAGSDGRGRDDEVHPFMYWSLMNHAAARGATLFDFGRSPVDGHRRRQHRCRLPPKIGPKRSELRRVRIGRRSRKGVDPRPRMAYLLHRDGGGNPVHAHR